MRPYDNTTSTRVDSGIAGRNDGRRQRRGGEGISRRTVVCGGRGGSGWRSSARWSISRGRLLDLQLHPREGRFWPFAGIRSQRRLAVSQRYPDSPTICARAIMILRICRISTCPRDKMDPLIPIDFSAIFNHERRFRKNRSF